MDDNDETPNRSIATIWNAQDERRQQKRREDNARRKAELLRVRDEVDAQRGGE